MSKDKKLVERRIFYKINYKEPFTWKDIKHLELQDDDEISGGYQESYNGTDCSNDAHYYINVTRKELETDQEHQIRLHNSERDAKWAKERRLESYKKLREEFKDLEL